MKKSWRLLPHLNQLYLQRQEKDSHQKKIQSIRSKNTNISNLNPQILTSRRQSGTSTIKSVRSISNSRISQKSKHSKSVLKQSPQTIPEIPDKLEKIPQWMSPFRKQQQYQKIKQNNRLILRIEKSSSKLRAASLRKQYERFYQIKKRISHYQRYTASEKSTLKSQKSLRSYHPHQPRQRKPLYQNKKRFQTEHGHHNLHRLSTNQSQLIRRSFELKRESICRKWKQKNWMKTNCGEQSQKSSSISINKPDTTYNLKQKFTQIVNTPADPDKHSKELPSDIQSVIL